MITHAHFGSLPDGRPVTLFTLANDAGATVKITNFGGIITSIVVPDRAGKPGEVTLGFDSLEDYLRPHPYFGCITGRFANRIAHGRFALDGKTYQLATNHGAHHLHGGNIGFDKRLWRPFAFSNEEGDSLALSYLSLDGEENYPGDLFVTVTYTLMRRENTLRICYAAQAGGTTILNLTNHAYFNLAGGGTVLDHELTINAESFLVVDEALIPTGEIRSVEGTPLDFRQPQRIGARINADFDQLRYGKGYDQSYVVSGEAGTLRLAARVYEPSSGRALEVLTTEPDLHLYAGNNLDGALVGRGGWRYEQYAGLCLETQHFPDAPNHPHFPSTVLRAGEQFRSETWFKFGVA
ncbi:MAG: galactose mutarotase [Thermoflexales bacterium]|nr:galactose mutarotase [Thermoflexales bacterium]